MTLIINLEVIILQMRISLKFMRKYSFNSFYILSCDFPEDKKIYSHPLIKIQKELYAIQYFVDLIFINLSFTSLRGDFEKTKKNRNNFDILEKNKILENVSKYIKDKDIIENIYSNDNQEFIRNYIYFTDAKVYRNNNEFELKYK